MTSTPIIFPNPADHNQIYPDYFSGDAALENGKVYQFDTVKGVWDVLCESDTVIGGGGGGGSSVDFLDRNGDTVGTSKDSIDYYWTSNLTFKSDNLISFLPEGTLSLDISKENVAVEVPLLANESIEINNDHTADSDVSFIVNDYFAVLGNGDVTLGSDGNAFMATADHHAVSKKYLDTGYVKKTGDVMTGSLTFDKVSSPIVFDPAVGQIQQIRVKNNTSGTSGVAIALEGKNDSNTFKIYGGPSASQVFLSVGGDKGLFTFSSDVTIDSVGSITPLKFTVNGPGSQIIATNGAEIASNVYKSSGLNSDITFKSYGDAKLIIGNTKTDIYSNVKIDGSLDLSGNRLDSVSSISVPNNSVIKSPDTGQNYMVFDEPNRSINTFATTVPEHEIYVFQPIKTVCGVLIRDDYKRGTASDYLFRVQADRAITENSLSGATGGLRTSFGVLGNGVIVLGSDENDPFIPTENHHAVSKYYVDKLIQDTLAGVDIGDNGNKVDVDGDTMTGDLYTPHIQLTGDTISGGSVFFGEHELAASSVKTTTEGPVEQQDLSPNFPKIPIRGRPLINYSNGYYFLSGHTKEMYYSDDLHDPDSWIKATGLHGDGTGYTHYYNGIWVNTGRTYHSWTTDLSSNNWTRVAHGANDNGISIIFKGRIICGGSEVGYNNNSAPGQGFIVSSDGKNWTFDTHVLTKLYNKSDVRAATRGTVDSIQEIDGRVYMVDDELIFWTTDFVNFEYKIMDKPVYNLCQDGNGHFIITTPSGIFKTEDHFDTVQLLKAHTDPPNYRNYPRTHQLSCDGANTLVATYMSHQTHAVWTSDDSGETWYPEELSAGVANSMSGGYYGSTWHLNGSFVTMLLQDDYEDGIHSTLISEPIYNPTGGSGGSSEEVHLTWKTNRVALYKELSGSIDLNQDSIDALRDHVDTTFVKKADGDEMEGPLRVTGGRSPDDDGIESTVKALNIDSGQNSSLNLKHNGNAKIYVGDEQTSFQGHIKFNVAGKQIYSGANKKGLAFYDNGVQYVGDYTAAKHIVTKEKLEEAINNIPTGGGDSSDKVSKTGDTMTGKLILSNSNALDLRGKVQINGTTTNNRFLGTDGSGNTTWKTALTSQTQANWNTTSTGDASYIKNKPRVVTGSNNNISITSSNGNYYISG